jgi:hypothetical protein
LLFFIPGQHTRLIQTIANLFTPLLLSAWFGLYDPHDAVYNSVNIFRSALTLAVPTHWALTAYPCHAGLYPVIIAH